MQLRAVVGICLSLPVRIARRHDALHRHRGWIGLFGVVAITSLLLPGPAGATDFFWTSPSGGLFTSPVLWNPSMSAPGGMLDTVNAWMPVGEQAQVKTPGNNVKRHVAGSLVWRTGTMLVSAPSKRRNAQSFVDHLEDLRRRLRRFKRIHVVCDNAPLHNCRLVREYLKQWGHRIVIHYLPKYAPETNPIERVWWHLHEVITRNHRCQSIDELLDLAYQWFETNNNHHLDRRHTFALAA